MENVPTYRFVCNFDNNSVLMTYKSDQRNKYSKVTDLFLRVKIWRTLPPRGSSPCT